MVNGQTILLLATICKPFVSKSLQYWDGIPLITQCDDEPIPWTLCPTDMVVRHLDLPADLGYSISAGYDCQTP